VKAGIFKKGTIIIQLILIISLCFIPTVYGTVLDPNKYKPNALATSDVGTLVSKGNAIIGVIQVIGSVVSVIVLAILGIKYMVGSVEERAEYKKTMLPYLVGAIMLFASANLVQMIYEWAIALNR